MRASGSIAVGGVLLPIAAGIVGRRAGPRSRKPFHHSAMHSGTPETKVVGSRAAPRRPGLDGHHTISMIEIDRDEELSPTMTEPSSGCPSPQPHRHRRRPRYSGTYPRRFAEKYKEHDPERYADTVEKVLASGKTPAGTHRPIMVGEILDILAPRPGEFAVDCTIGFGGHAQAILQRLLPGGRLLGLDADPIQLPKTERRLRALGFGPDTLSVCRTNFAGLPRALAGDRRIQPRPDTTGNPVEQHSEFDSIPHPRQCVFGPGADMILVDLGVSSMQLDEPARGFSAKCDGPVDMRINPQRGQPASALLERIRSKALSEILTRNADEPEADRLAAALAGNRYTGTLDLARAVRDAVPLQGKDAVDGTIRRVFQALRIAVNDEFSALETLLRHLPECLNCGGRIAVLTFHSGEDRRVKKAFQAGLRGGTYSNIARDVIRPTPAERRANPRSSSAKLRWARKS